MPFEKIIKLFDKEYILSGSLEKGGPITTVEAFKKFECSFAHLMPDGRIMRFKQQIGTVKDIEVSNLEIDITQEASLEKILTAIIDPKKWSEEEKKSFNPKED